MCKVNETLSLELNKLLASKPTSLHGKAGLYLELDILSKEIEEKSKALAAELVNEKLLEEEFPEFDKVVTLATKAKSHLDVQKIINTLGDKVFLKMAPEICTIAETKINGYYTEDKAASTVLIAKAKVIDGEGAPSVAIQNLKK